MNQCRLHLWAGMGFLIILLFSCGVKNSKAAVIDPMKSEKLTNKALALSRNLLEKGQAMANSGKSMLEILQILPDSTLVQTNAEAILYFIEGSVPMLIELPRDPNAPLTKGSRKSISLAVNNSGINSVAAPLSVAEDEPINVVAYEKGEEQREEKKALIISPYISDFGNFDDGNLAYEYLSKNKNFKNGITHLKLNVTLESYASFEDFDLLHISTHGMRFDNPIQLILNGQIVPLEIEGVQNESKVLLNTGISTNLDIIEFFDSEKHPEFSQFKDHVVIDEGYFHLKSSFFDHFYGAGLENKIWIFSACEMGQESDVSNSMNQIHTNGHFFYWLNQVDVPDAYKAFDKFYNNLEKEGLDAERAFEKIPDKFRSNLPSSINDTIIATTSLLHLNTGESRHGIEVVEMFHPEEEDQTIRSGDFYPLVGDFGDGEDEALTLRLELKGYTREEFEEKNMGVGLKVDDEIVLWNKPFLPDLPDDGIEVEDLEDQEYGVEVRIADIAIPDVGDKERITLKAYLHFDQERFSIHKEEVIIKADGIKAIVRGNGNTVTMTYDDKRRSLRIVTSGNQRTMYMDEAGYIYNYSNNQGWVKINLGGFMGMMGQMPFGQEFANSPMQDMLQPSNKNFFFPMVEWGIRFRMSAFERNTNFKKQEEDCDKPEPCYRFNGIAGQEQGVSALFDPNGRLKELRYQGSTIKYEYGMFDVIIPEATEMNIGI